MHVTLTNTDHEGNYSWGGIVQKRCKKKAIGCGKMEHKCDSCYWWSIVLGGPCAMIFAHAAPMRPDPDCVTDFSIRSFYHACMCACVARPADGDGSGGLAGGAAASH
jgi:hypothetical protein